jgi:hypothetical protein
VPDRGILAAYRAEVLGAKRWLQQHRQVCPQCAASMRLRPHGPLCATGRRIERYQEMNQQIVDKLAAQPDGDLIQGTLW